MIIASAKDFREAARRRLPRFLFDYADGGAYAEETLRRNVSDLAGIALRQRVLKDVAAIDLSTSLFGRQVSLPVALGRRGLDDLHRHAAGQLHPGGIGDIVERQRSGGGNRRQRDHDRDHPRHRPGEPRLGQQLRPAPRTGAGKDGGQAHDAGTGRRGG